MDVDVDGPGKDVQTTGVDLVRRSPGNLGRDLADDTGVDGNVDASELAGGYYHRATDDEVIPRHGALSATNEAKK
jgi:hypothetical protein